MSHEAVRDWLTARGFGDRVHRFEKPSSTVELAAEAIGVEPERIAKTMAIIGPDGPVLVVAAGDRRLDGGKFKRTFHFKPHFIAPAEVEDLVGHAPGGVCPFGVKEGVPVWLDVSLKAYETVWPACGDGTSGAELTPDEMERATDYKGWVDVTRPPAAPAATNPAVG
ncbi:YbaK/EbsC family protein [Sutterella sp.]|uniref:YbaK/EbsC family protein n=1 Tax=Sutterella sp. TaxID=1981025 RepID=UPI0026DF06C6|nr:YbaK/EbsC family protein [Sutterella sp.]MDO5532463.1 YbaK/EbsC family protein [Sutterella sp.]